MDQETRTHLVGLLLGTENDWPVAFESLVRALGPIPDAHGVTHEIQTERARRAFEKASLFTQKKRAGPRHHGVGMHHVQVRGAGGGQEIKGTIAPEAATAHFNITVKGPYTPVEWNSLFTCFHYESKRVVVPEGH